MLNTPLKILIVDADNEVLESTTQLLAAEKYEIVVADNSRRAIELAEQELPNLILLELLMPELDGIDICIELRKKKELNETLIVFHTTRAEDYSQIAAFNAGADDYIVKPVKPRVLTTRIKALLKRHYSFTQEIEKIQAQGLVIDRERYLVLKDGQEIVLPRKEFELLALLITAPRKVFTRKEISENIWGYEILASNRTIDVHIRKLREKIGDNYIKTIKGIGYTLEM
jgi:two-component system alkaline phosphatase synthesis response regulator PhoP